MTNQTQAPRAVTGSPEHRVADLARAIRKYGKGFGYGDLEVALLDADALEALLDRLEQGAGEVVAWLVEWKHKPQPGTSVPGGGSEIIRNQYAAVEEKVALLQQLVWMDTVKVTPLAPVPDAPQAGVVDWLSLTRKNLATMEEQVRRHERWGKVSCELQLAIDETRQALALPVAPGGSGDE